MDLKYPNQQIIHGGVEKQEYCFKWIIDNFEHVMKNKQFINWQKNRINIGNLDDLTLQWKLRLKYGQEADGTGWLGIIIRLVNGQQVLDANKELSVQFEIKVENEQNKSVFFQRTTEVKNLTTLTPDACTSGFQTILKTTTPIVEVPLLNGALPVRLKITVFTNKNLGELTPQVAGTDIKERQYESNRCLVKDYKQLYTSGKETSDVRIFAGHGEDQTEFFAHKVVLQARSPVFAGMFHAGWSIENKLGRITIPDVTSKTMAVLLNHIYTSNVHSVMGLGGQDVVQVAYAADKYDVKDLFQFCDDILAEKCDMSNAFHLLSAAENLNLQKAKQGIIKFIRSNLSGAADEDIVKLAAEVPPAKRARLHE